MQQIHSLLLLLLLAYEYIIYNLRVLNLNLNIRFIIRFDSVRYFFYFFYVDRNTVKTLGRMTVENARRWTVHNEDYDVIHATRSTINR